jgi:hypothetical protein
MATVDKCCQAALDLKGLDYMTRAQVIAGIKTLRETQKIQISYSEYMNVKKACETQINKIATD